MGALTSFPASHVPFFSPFAVRRSQITVRGAQQCTGSHKSVRWIKKDREKEDGPLSRPHTTHVQTAPHYFPSASQAPIDGRFFRITTPERERGREVGASSFYLHSPTASLMTGPNRARPLSSSVPQQTRRSQAPAAAANR